MDNESWRSLSTEPALALALAQRAELTEALKTLTSQLDDLGIADNVFVFARFDDRRVLQTTLTIDDLNMKSRPVDFESVEDAPALVATLNLPTQRDRLVAFAALSLAEVFPGPPMG